MNWAVERIIEFMFAIVLVVGAGKLGYEIREWEERVLILPDIQDRLEEARDKVIEYQDKLKAKGKVNIVEYHKTWIECDRR